MRCDVGEEKGPFLCSSIAGFAQDRKEHEQQLLFQPPLTKFLHTEPAVELLRVSEQGQKKRQKKRSRCWGWKKKKKGKS